jgi:hypothetical protein
MPNIYYIRYDEDEGWDEWEGGHEMPPLYYDFDPDVCNISIASRADGHDWCHAYDPEAGLITWCTWSPAGWSDWHAVAELPPPPNWGEDTFFSVGAHSGTDSLYSYDPEEETLYWSTWTGFGYGMWEGPIEVDCPPNIEGESDVFMGGDGQEEFMVCLNRSDWSVFYSEWDGEEGEYTEWERLDDIHIPEGAWGDVEIDFDGDVRDGELWIYATVYENDDD